MNKNENVFVNGAVSPLETKRSRGESGDAGEPGSKRSRDRNPDNHPEGNQDEGQENRSNEESDQPEPEEFILPKGPTTPPSPTTAE